MFRFSSPSSLTSSQSRTRLVLLQIGTRRINIRMRWCAPLTSVTYLQTFLLIRQYNLPWQATGGPSSSHERGRDSCLRAVLCYKRLFIKACMGCKRFFLKERKNVMFFNKIDVPYCLLVFFVGCPRLRPFWSEGRQRPAVDKQTKSLAPLVTLTWLILVTRHTVRSVNGSMAVWQFGSLKFGNRSSKRWKHR